MVTVREYMNDIVFIATFSVNSWLHARFKNINENWEQRGVKTGSCTCFQKNLPYILDGPAKDDTSSLLREKWVLSSGSVLNICGAESHEPAKKSLGALCPET